MSFLNDCSPGSCLKALRTSAVVMAGALAMAMAIPAANAANGLDPDAGAATGAGLFPQFLEGNQNCAQVATPGTIEFRLNEVANGTFDVGGLNVTIELTGNNTFKWTANSGSVADIVVKGGPDANWFDYDGHGLNLNMDTLLHSPVNTKNGNFYGLSHISFCYFPGDPDMEVTKECPDPPTLIDGGAGGAVYNYSVTIDNTGDGALDTFVVTEALDDMVGISCAITAPAANAVDINGATSIPNLMLAQGASVVLNVACTADAPLDGQPNFIDITADTDFAHEPQVSDDSTATCPENAPPPISINKECGDPMIRLVEVDTADGTILGVQACVNITVMNEGFAGDETLVDVMLMDDVVFGVGNSEDLPNLAPQEFHSDTYCYFPAAPTGPTLGETNGLTWYSIFTVLETDQSIAEALFSNTASVTAAGAFSGTPVGPVEDSAHCSICVSDEPGLPAECPQPENNPLPLFQ